MILPAGAAPQAQAIAAANQWGAIPPHAPMPDQKEATMYDNEDIVFVGIQYIVCQQELFPTYKGMVNCSALSDEYPRCPLFSDHRG